MSIANELSSDVAAAVLARSRNGSSEGKSQPDKQELVELLFDFHSALRALTIEARRRRFLRAPLSGTEPPPTLKHAANGN